MGEEGGNEYSKSSTGGGEEAEVPVVLRKAEASGDEGNEGLLRSLLAMVTEGEDGGEEQRRFGCMVKLVRTDQPKGRGRIFIWLVGARTN